MNPIQLEDTPESSTAQRTWVSQLGPYFDQPPETDNNEPENTVASTNGESSTQNNQPENTIVNTNTNTNGESSTQNNEPEVQEIQPETGEPIVVISSDSGTTEGEDEDEDESEEDESEEDEESDAMVISTPSRVSESIAPRGLSRNVASIAGYSSLRKDVRQRAERAMTQRMLILSRETMDDYCEDFEVIGTIGSAYKVTVGQRLSCTCIDFDSRSVHCKHILMILLKVYRLDFTSPLYRSLTTTTELRRNVIMNSVPDPSAFVSEEVRQRINNVLYRPSSSTATATRRTRAEAQPLAYADCPICFDPFNEEDISNIEHCWTCGNNIHHQCLERWFQTRGSTTNQKCVYCQARWHESEQDEPQRRSVTELDNQHVDEYGYVNVAAEAGLSRERPEWFPPWDSPPRRSRRRRRYEYDYDECDCDCCDHSGYY